MLILDLTVSVKPKKSLLLKLSFETETFLVMLRVILLLQEQHLKEGECTFAS